MCEHLRCPYCIHCVRCNEWAGIVAPTPIGKPCKVHLRCTGCSTASESYTVDAAGMAAVTCKNCGKVEMFASSSPWLHGLRCSTIFQAC